MVGSPCLSACQLFESLLPRDKLLRIRKLEWMSKNLLVAQMPEARQSVPDLRGHRIVPVAMPPQNELRLLPEILEVRHGRSYDCGVVGGLCPFGLTPMRPTATQQGWQRPARHSSHLRRHLAIQAQILRHPRVVQNPFMFGLWTHQNSDKLQGLMVGRVGTVAAIVPLLFWIIQTSPAGDQHEKDTDCTGRGRHHRRHAGCFRIGCRCPMAPARLGRGPALPPASSAAPSSPVPSSRRARAAMSSTKAMDARFIYRGCYWAAEPIYNRHGHVIGYTGEPVQVCPGYRPY